MSTYGDRGNVICLKRRCGGGYTVSDATRSKRHATDLQTVDLLVGGGAQDRQKSSCVTYAARALLREIDSGTPGVFTCGALSC